MFTFLHALLMYISFYLFSGCCFVTFYTRKDSLEAQNKLHNIKTLAGVSQQNCYEQPFVNKSMSSDPVTDYNEYMQRSASICIVIF